MKHSPGFSVLIAERPVEPFIDPRLSAHRGHLQAGPALTAFLCHIRVALLKCVMHLFLYMNFRMILFSLKETKRKPTTLEIQNGIVINVLILEYPIYAIFLSFVIIH